MLSKWFCHCKNISCISLEMKTLSLVMSVLFRISIYQVIYQVIRFSQDNISPENLTK